MKIDRDVLSRLYAGGRFDDLQILLERLEDRSPKGSESFGLARFYKGLLELIQGVEGRAKVFLFEAIENRHFSTHICLDVAQMAWERGWFDLVASALRRVITVVPRIGPAVYVNLSLALESINQARDGVTVLERCLQLFPTSAEAYEQLGALKSSIGDIEGATRTYQCWLSSGADRASDARLNLAICYQRMSDFDVSLEQTESFSSEQSLDSRWAVVHLQNLIGTGRTSEAGAFYISQEARFGDDAKFLAARAQQLEMALADPKNTYQVYQRALVVSPGDVSIIASFASFLHRSGETARGLNLAQEAVSRSPRDFEALLALANILQDEKCYLRAMEQYRVLLEIYGFRPAFACQLFSCSVALGSFEEAHRTANELLSHLQSSGKKSEANPFTLLSILNNQNLFCQCAKDYAIRNFGNIRVRREIDIIEPAGDKIKLGFFSADFRNHPVGIIFSYLVRQLDRERFDIICFDFSPNPSDFITEAIDELCKERINCTGKSGDQIRKICESREIHVAVEMGGYTIHSPLKYFATRLAPIQIEYLGFANSTGVEAIDFIVADEYIIESGQEPLETTETPLILSEPLIPIKPFININKGNQVGSMLSTGYTNFIFIATHTFKKINLNIIESWVRISKSVPFGVFWLSSFGGLYDENFSKSWAELGGSIEQLIFLPQAPSRDSHLVRLSEGHLFLDTWPYCSHSTACEVLGLGIPIVSFPQPTFHGRIAASLLASLDLSERLVANSIDRYESIAVRLAQRPDEYCDLCACLRTKLAVIDQGPDTYGLSLGQVFEDAISRSMFR